ncbi:MULTISPECIES: acyl-CoA dehydrogenase family protein [unclassified Hwanghaeella]|uniref:acyl-CoA dehydrogenase family protein n=1 Tax=unclassified Hwanghaeella TaxID=2605944 RepID=UPI00267D0AEA
MITSEARLYALSQAESLAAEAVDHLSQTVRNAETGRVDPIALERAQHQAHGTAWLVSHVAGLTALHDWAQRLEETNSMGPVEAGILRIGFAEYLNRIIHGLPMGQTETVRPHELGTSLHAMGMATDPTLNALFADPDLPEIRMATALAMSEHGFSNPADDPDGEISMMRTQYQRFAEAEIAPFCHRWHLDDILIPDETVQKVADLGTFAITIPQAYDGLGLSKQAMVAVTEELSSFHLPTGSLATRPEIAGELISNSGTQDQKERFLPGIASGKIMTTAVFTEPDIGSDLAHLSTRAVRRGAVYQVSGAKTWITHGGRSDLMTLLVRTQAGSQDHSGVSMLLAEKPRGTPATPFPAPGMTGGEIRTLGYRGMKEYDIAFDRFDVPAHNLLGGEEGLGFRQLMATFESARIQTAARAVGVARNALRLAMDYATTRRQFGQSLIRFPRIADKLALMAAETEIVRQLTRHAALAKDTGRRCDVEAGMAKLLAARTAWAAADDALQIHGGIGYALESQISRVLVDARILNIFEGTGEIQAQVIARGLLSRRN